MKSELELFFGTAVPNGATLKINGKTYDCLNMPHCSFAFVMNRETFNPKNFTMQELFHHRFSFEFDTKTSNYPVFKCDIDKTDYDRIPIMRNSKEIYFDRCFKLRIVESDDNDVYNIMIENMVLMLKLERNAFLIPMFDKHYLFWLTPSKNIQTPNLKNQQHWHKQREQTVIQHMDDTYYHDRNIGFAAEARKKCFFDSHV